MNGIYLLLGSNLGNRFKVLAQAVSMIRGSSGVVVAESGIYESEPWGFDNQPNFLNKVIQVDTNLNPTKLLEELQKIELEMGRVREVKWRERLIDIDILYYNNEIINEPNLSIPHPEIPNRRFTLVPLCELATDQIHPILRQTQGQLLQRCQDELKVEKAIPQNYPDEFI